MLRSLVTSPTVHLAGLALSPDGNHLLSNSMDNSVIMWDVRPFANQNRLEKTFHGIKVSMHLKGPRDGVSVNRFRASRVGKHANFPYGHVGRRSVELSSVALVTESRAY